MPTSPPDHAELVDLLRVGRYHDVLARVGDADRGLTGAARARALTMLGRLDEATTLARTVLSRAVGDRDAQAEAQTLYYLASIHVARNQPLHALRLAHRTVRVARPAGLRSLAASALANIADLKSQVGDLVGAAAALAEASAELDALDVEHPDPTFDRHTPLRMTAALLALRRGHLDEARAVLDAQDPNDPASELPVWCTLRCLIAIAEERLDDALAAAEQGIERSPPERTADAMLLRSEVLRLRGETRAAHEALQEVRRRQPPHGSIHSHASALALLLEVDQGHHGAALDAALSELAGASAPQTLWLARIAVVRVATTRGHPSAWDAAWSRRPSWLGYAPANVAFELARLAEETAARPEPAWGPRAVRVWAATADLAQAAGASKLAQRARDRLSDLAANGAPVPLGPFLVGPRIGEGRQAQVRQGSTLLGREVAVKIEHRVGHRSTTELRHAAALSHPRIAPVLAFGTVPGPLAPMLRCDADSRWVAMPLAEGTLHALAGQLPWTQLRTVLTDVLTGLAHMHARGLLHLDVKPENVLVSTDPLRARLTDFGVARALSRCSGRIPIAGTPAFMAPEQFDGHGRALGPWTDLYAVGGTAWTLVTGALPFPGDLDDLIRASHTRLPEPVEPTGSVPDGFDSWIRGLMAKRPGDRYQRAADALRDLMRLGDHTDPPPPRRARGPLPSMPTMSLQTLPEGAPASSQPTLVLEPTRRAQRTEPPGRGPRATRHARIAVPSQWRSEQVGPLPLDPSAQLDLLPLREPPITGRNAERDALWEALREVSAESVARVVVVEGVLGAGATRLAQWLGERAHALGVAHVWHSSGDAGDLQLDALRTLVRGDDSRTPADLARHLIDEGWPQDLAIEVADVACGLDELGTFELDDLLRRAVHHLAEERTVLWVLDDVDEAPGADRMLRAVLQARAPLLIVGTASHLPGSEPTQLLVGVEGVSRLSLGPMADDELDDLLGSLLPLDDVSAERLVADSGGWPGVLVAHLRAHAAAGAFGAEGTTLRLHHRGTREAVDTAAWAEVVEAALEPLSLGGTVAAELVGILGPHVPDAVWVQACAAAGVTAPDEARRTLLARRLILETSGGVRPVHPSIQRALVAHARAQEREVLLHEVAAEVVREPRQRAVHLRASRRLDEAVTAWNQAAARAASSFRLDEWAFCLVELQSTLDDCEPSHLGWFDLYGHRASLASARGDLDESHRLLMRVRDRAQALGQPLWDARAHLYLARNPRLDDPSFAAALGRARRLYDDLDNPLGQAACELALGQRAARRGALARAQLHMDRAVQLAGDSALRADAERMLAVVLARMGRHDEAAATLQGAIEDTAEGSRGVLLRDAMAHLARHRGDLPEAEHQLRRALELRPLGRARWMVQLHLATVLWARGQPAEARRLTFAVDAAVPRSGDDPDLWCAALLVVAEADDPRPGPRWQRGLSTLVAKRDSDDEPVSGEVAWALELAATRAAAVDQSERVSYLRGLRSDLSSATPDRHRAAPSPDTA